MVQRHRKDKVPSKGQYLKTCVINLQSLGRTKFIERLVTIREIYLMMFIIIKDGFHHSLHDAVYQEYYISKVFLFLL